MLKSIRAYIKNQVRDEVSRRLLSGSGQAVEDLQTRVSAIENELRQRKQFRERQELKKAPFPERANDSWSPLRLTRELKPTTHRRVIMLPVQVVGVKKPGTRIRHDMAFITSAWPGSQEPKVTIFHGNKNQDVDLVELATMYDYYYLAVAE